MMNAKKIEVAIHAYDGKLSAYDTMRLRLFQALWAIMARTEAQAAASVPTYDADELAHDLAEGQPFMANHPIPVDAESLADVVSLLVACVVDAQVYQSDVNTALKALNIRQLIYVSDTALAAVDPEQYLNSLVEAMQNFGVDGAQITILIGLVSLGLRALLEPAADAMMRQVTDAQIRDAHAKSCPVCGGRPALATLATRKAAESTGRKLACLQCGTEWEYDRFACPHCGTDDFSQLGYRTIKGDDAHRVDFCKACGNYIRTSVIETPFHPYSIDVEDCMMAQLDAFADSSERGEG